jgi:hypothetical protein
MDVRNAADQNMGDVEDVVLDRNSGSIAYAVVSFGGFLGMGDKLFAVPWSSLKTSADGKSFVLDVPKERLEKAPGFDKNNWPNMSDPQWATEIRTFYGTQPDVRPPEPKMPDAEKRENGGMRHDGHENGMTDRNRMKEDGRENGQRSFAVHSGKVKTFQRSDPSELVITTDRGEIQAELAPATFIEQQRLTFDPNANVTVSGYETMRNGRSIFVVTEVTTADGRVVRLRRDDTTPLWTQATIENRMESPSAIRDVSGTVTYVESGACESPHGRLVTIRTDAGERVIALGPGSYLDRQRWDLRPNETIVVRGYDYDRDGRRVFIATEVRKGSQTWRLRSDDGTPLWR